MKESTPPAMVVFDCIFVVIETYGDERGAKLLCRVFVRKKKTYSKVTL